MVEMSPEKLTAEKALVLFRHLPPDEQRRFRELMEQEASSPEHLAEIKRGGRRVPPPVPYIDRTREMNWLQEHSREYVGKWVALWEDQLISYGDDGVAIFAEAKAKGIERPMLVHVEDPDGLPYAGW